ncbi:MAG: hypothetical protein ACSLFK_16990 [Gemmatimonadaceae bacterium]
MIARGCYVRDGALEVAPSVVAKAVELETDAAQPSCPRAERRRAAGTC